MIFLAYGLILEVLFLPLADKFQFVCDMRVQLLFLSTDIIPTDAKEYVSSLMASHSCQQLVVKPLPLTGLHSREWLHTGCAVSRQSDSICVPRHFPHGWRESTITMFAQVLSNVDITQRSVHGCQKQTYLFQFQSYIT